MAHRAVALEPISLTQPQLVALRLMQDSPTGQVMWVRNFFGRAVDPSHRLIAKLTADKLVALRLAKAAPLDAPLKDRGLVSITDAGRQLYEKHRAQYQKSA